MGLNDPFQQIQNSQKIVGDRMVPKVGEVRRVSYSDMRHEAFDVAYQNGL